MRILFLNNYYYIRGGSERVLFDEMKLLSLFGQETAIFSRTNARNESAFYDRYFPPDIITNQIRFSFKALKTVKEIIYSDEAKRRLLQVIDLFKPDIAHTHNIYGRLSLSVLDALKEKKIPTVLTLHDYKLLCPVYLMLNHGQICERCKDRNHFHAFFSKCHKNSYPASLVYAFESWFNHRFNKYDSVRNFISPSRFLRNKAIEFGWHPEKIIYIPNFIEPTKVPVQSFDGSYFLYFGRLSHEKGVGTLLNAYHSILASTKTTNIIPKLFIVGDGPIRKELESTFGDNNVHVQFFGHLSGKALEDAIGGAQFIVMPSEWYENAPLSLLEAFAFGKPVIGSRIGGIPEMIEDGVNGFLFKAGNCEELRGKLEIAMNLPNSKIREMGMAAREKVEREYNATVHYKKLMEVYSNALGRPCE